MPPKIQPSEQRRFDIGQDVMARWPKSNLYFKGEVIDFNDIEYLVRFDDEEQSELTVKYKDVMQPFRSRSKSRSVGRTSRSSSQSRSPSRKSPSRRSPGRKSPGRRKSPSRKKSPSRRKSPVSSSPGRSVRNSSRQSANKSAEATLNSESAKSSLFDKLESSVKKLELIGNDGSSELRNRSETVATLTATRHSTRLATALEQKVFDVKTNNSSAGSNSLKVDTKTVIKSVERKNKYLDLTKRLFMALWFSLLAILQASLGVAIPYFLFTLCTAKNCDIRVPDFPPKLNIDQRTLVIGSGFLVASFLLSFVPIGKIFNTKSGSKIRLNGFLSLVASAIFVSVLVYKEYNVTPIYLLLRHFLLAFAGFGIVVSLLLYIKSFYGRRDNLNPKGNTGHYLVDFVEGREINPRIGSFDIKFFLIRNVMLLIIFINVIIIAKTFQPKVEKEGKNVEASTQYLPTLLVSAALKVFFSLDFIFFEKFVLTSYEYTNVGFGFTTVLQYMMMPFFYTIDVRYIYNYRPQMPWYCIVGIVAIALIGYAIMKGANAQKHAFRVNPSDPSLTHLESLPTATGKRLLVSGWWGFVRHPNYLGDIIVQIAMTLLCGFSHLIPWLVSALSFVFLLLRIFIVEKSCKAKYGLAWTSYTSRVPYRLIPKIF